MAAWQLICSVRLARTATRHIIQKSSHAWQTIKRMLIFILILVGLTSGFGQLLFLKKIVSRYCRIWLRWLGNLGLASLECQIHLETKRSILSIHICKFWNEAIWLVSHSDQSNYFLSVPSVLLKPLKPSNLTSRIR